jgi:hypothetical protein
MIPAIPGGGLPRFARFPLILLLALLCLPAGASYADGVSRRLLGKQVEAIDLRQRLVPADAFRPYPPIDDRAAWSGVPEGQRQAFIGEAERLLGTEWAHLPATRFLDYVRDGNRSRYEDLLFSRRRKLAFLVLGELMEDRGRFTDAIVDGIWLICEESFWGVPAHLDVQKRGRGLPDVAEPTVDLFAAETGALLAWTDHLLGKRLDAVHPMVRERIRLEVTRRILDPALTRDFWWMGSGTGEVTNWTPWIGSNWLVCALLLERDPGRRADAVLKIVRCLDFFIDAYPDDGGSAEGPGYWVRGAGSLFESLELLHSATGGRIDIFREPVVREIGRYIARAYIHGDYYVNAGDCAPRLRPVPEIVFRYGRAVGDPALEGFGSFLAARRGPFGPRDVSSTGSLAPVLPALLRGRTIPASRPVEPLDGENWMPDLQMMTAREMPGTPDGLYLAVIGGHNGQSHSHNDVGNLIVYADGEPLLVDAGVEAYTAGTFGSGRYGIWTMQSEWHNLPVINGLGQGSGVEFRARDAVFSSGTGAVRLALDIASAYPPGAKVETWRREVTLDRGKREVVLAEDYVLGEAREPVRLHFLTPLPPDVSTAGRVLLARPGGGTVPPGGGGAGYALLYDASRFAAKVETKELADRRLKNAWGDRLYRIVLTAQDLAGKGSHRIVVRRAD